MQAGETVDLGVRPPHSAMQLKITEESADRPVLVHTDGHCSMGLEVQHWRFDGNTLCVATCWPWPTPLALTLAAPEGRVWKPCGGAALSDDGALLTYATKGSEERHFMLL